MAQFVLDSFTGVDGTTLNNHTGEIGATWASQASSYALISNRVYSSAGGVSTYASGVAVSNDMTVEADFFVASNLASAYIGIWGRGVTTAETYYAVRYVQGTGWVLGKYITGTHTSLGSFAQTLTVGQSYHAKLSIIGSTLTVYIDTVQRIQVTNETSITTGTRVGMRGSAETSTTGYHIDNFNANDPTSGVSILYDRLGSSFGQGILNGGFRGI